jgi:hypothetical protein
MSLKSTTKDVLLSTALAVTSSDYSYQPIYQTKFVGYSYQPTSVGYSYQFESGYKMVDHNIVRSDIVVTFQVINSLLDIANILFKNARDETPSELKAKRAYFKSKYKKV